MISCALRKLYQVYKVTCELYIIELLILQGCLGALDGTYINVRVPLADIPRYRNRKGQITTNTIAVCDQHLRFIYVFPGWEGSAGDSRILRDAVSRPLGLQVPKGMTVVGQNYTGPNHRISGGLAAGFDYLPVLHSLFA
ncbi:hypothetical protein SASPL_101810 [Salvia splendens]|uniref:DDE Tnp4 domain-containing protein n=1 Tax=Salvia splendens TaxID=180675 RepID=A0A8X8YV78_SALSN|nr:hypothetical protein SASPL_101810 [Salvia splendens]